MSTIHRSPAHHPEPGNDILLWRLLSYLFPKEMKKVKNQAAVLYAPHDIRIEERPVPTPRMREVLIEIKAVGVCGSDVHYYEHGKSGSYVVRQPHW